MRPFPMTPVWGHLCLAAFLAAIILTAVSTASASSPVRVGGPCSYTDVHGTAAIVEVSPLAPSPEIAAGLPYQPYCVRFAFTPDGPVSHHLYSPGAVHELTLTGGARPGPAFLAKYAIRTGLRLQATMRLIDSGTCTPVLFGFEGLKLDEHLDPARN